MKHAQPRCGLCKREQSMLLPLYRTIEGTLTCGLCSTPPDIPEYTWEAEEPPAVSPWALANAIAHIKEWRDT